MDHLTDLNNMYLFAKVVDHGGFTPAAKALGLHTSMLSRRIVALETELGVRLLNRNSRRVSLTDAGRLFYQHCVALVEEARAAKTAIDQTRAPRKAWYESVARWGFCRWVSGRSCRSTWWTRRRYGSCSTPPTGASTSSKKAWTSPCACACRHWKTPT